MKFTIVILAEKSKTTLISDEIPTTISMWAITAAVSNIVYVRIMTFNDDALLFCVRVLLCR
jgi:hypothetical protein